MNNMQGYGVFVLIVEIIGATTVMLYGVNLLFNPVIDKFEEDPNLPGHPKVCPPPLPRPTTAPSRPLLVAMPRTRLKTG